MRKQNSTAPGGTDPFAPKSNAYGGYAYVQTGPSQYLGDFHLAQHWAQHFELPGEITNEFGEFVYRLGQLDQGIGSLFVDAP